MINSHALLKLNVVSFICGFMLLSVILNDLLIGIMGLIIYISTLSIAKNRGGPIINLAITAYIFWIPVSIIVLYPYAMKFKSYGTIFLFMPLIIPAFLCFPFFVGALFSKKVVYIVLNPLAIVLLEYVNRYGLISNDYIIPWSTLVYFSDLEIPFLRNEYAIGFILLSIVSCIIFITSNTKNLKPSMIILSLCVITGYVLEIYFVKYNHINSSNRIPVNIIQTSSSTENYSANFQINSNRLFKKDFLNILPESSYPYKIFEPYINYKQLYDKSGSVISGVIRSSSGKSYNSAFYMNNGNIIRIFDKSALVPIIETSWLSRSHTLDSRININNTNFLILVCFELYFEKKYGGIDTNALIVLANNNSQIGLKFQLYFAKMRAKTLNVPIIFASNNGGSVFISNLGKYSTKMIDGWGSISNYIP